MELKYVTGGMPLPNLVERVFEKRLRRIVSVNEMQFGFMPERGTIDAVFILRRKQEEHHAIGKKLCMYFADLEKDFDRVPRKVLDMGNEEEGNTRSFG